MRLAILGAAIIISTAIRPELDIGGETFFGVVIFVLIAAFQDYTEMNKK